MPNELIDRWVECAECEGGGELHGMTEENENEECHICSGEGGEWEKEG